jgi:hypothetical protein
VLAGAVLIWAAATHIAASYLIFPHICGEPAHIAAGMEWLDRGKCTYEPMHPPLTRVAVTVGPWARSDSAVWSTDRFPATVRSPTPNLNYMYQAPPSRSASASRDATPENAVGETCNSDALAQTPSNSPCQATSWKRSVEPRLVRRRAHERGRAVDRWLVPTSLRWDHAEVVFHSAIGIGCGTSRSPVRSAPASTAHCSAAVRNLCIVDALPSSGAMSRARAERTALTAVHERGKWGSTS